MKKRAVYTVWAIWFAVAAICQLSIPDSFDAAFFAFPVNVALLLLCGAVLWVLCRENPNAALTVALSAPSATFLLISVAVATCLVLGLTSWLKPASWWFFFVFAALIAHLSIVTFRGLRSGKPNRLRFVLNHAGLLLALVGGFVGSADAGQWRLRVADGGVTSEAFAKDGGAIRLQHEIGMERFAVEYYADGNPADYQAHLTIDGKPVAVKVNRPYSLSAFDNLYLVDYEHVPAGERVGYCTLEIVRQPWKYLLWTGIVMMLAGSVLLFAQKVSVPENFKMR
ncbi:MAG: cytochrome c biogenesis protein ResB [Alistipes sp.]